MISQLLKRCRLVATLICLHTERIGLQLSFVEDPPLDILIINEWTTSRVGLKFICKFQWPHGRLFDIKEILNAHL